MECRLNKVVFVLLFVLLFLFVSSCDKTKATEEETETETTSAFLSETQTPSTLPAVDNEHFDKAHKFINNYQYEEAEKEFLLAIDELKRSGVANDNARMAIVEHELGHFYLKMGRYNDAYDHLQSSYISFRDIYGEDSEYVLLYKASICLYDMSVGNYDQALASLLEIYEKVSSDDGKAQTTNLIGNVYLNIGEYDKAESWLKDALAYANKADYNPDEIYNDLGGLYMIMGRNNEALECFLSSKKIAQNKGNDCREICYNVVMAYMNLGNYDSAINELNELLNLDISRYQEQSAAVAYDYHLFSRFYRNNYDYENQLIYLNKAIDILKSIYGENTHEMSVFYDDLGSCYYMKCDYEKAYKYMQDSMEIKKNILEHNSNGARILYANMGNVLSNLKDYEGALQAHKKEYDIAVALYGENSYYAGLGLIDIANSELELGKINEASEHVASGIQMMQNRNNSSSYGCMGDAWKTVGRINRAQGKRQEAIQAYKTAINEYSEYYGKNCSTNAVIYYEIATIHFESENYTEAIEAYEAFIDVIKVTKSGNDMAMQRANNLSSAYNSIGFCLYKLKKYDEALIKYQEGLDCINEFFNIASDDGTYKNLYEILASLYNNIGAVHEDNGKLDAARKYVKLAYDTIKKYNLDESKYTKTFERMKRLSVKTSS